MSSSTFPETLEARILEYVPLLVYVPLILAAAFEILEAFTPIRPA